MSQQHITVDFIAHRERSERERNEDDYVDSKLQGKQAVRDDLVHIPGDTIMSNAEGWMDGHGSYTTMLPDKRTQMTASVAGIRQVFTRVVVVYPLKSRYAGEIGDIVVGRILQVGRKAWTVINICKQLYQK